MYRLYVDESGDHTYTSLEAAHRRYLALVGCFFDLQHYQESFQPQLEELKARFFRHDPDEPVILHREDLINARGSFRFLLDPEVRNSFNSALLSVIWGAAFKIIAVVIDKKAHVDRYGDAAWHPYHYCLAVMLERYCGYLHFCRGKGDVVAESRGKREDMQLKEEYERIYRQGTHRRSAQWFQLVLTSHELKVKPKSKDIAGLQLTDLIAHPAKQEVLLERGRLAEVSGSFGQEICKMLASKYNRHLYSAQLWGYGKILLD